jgi:hypothetical protein
MRDYGFILRHGARTALKVDRVMRRHRDASIQNAPGPGRTGMSLQRIRAVVWIACLMVGWGSWARADTLIVARRGWHIDVGFPVGELAPPLDSMDREFPGARSIFFGFGDRRYLLSRHRGAPVLLRALWPGAGLILATGLNAAPAAAFGASHIVAVSVSREGSLRAQAFVWNAMTEDQRAALRLRDAPVGIPGPYEGSAFFESRLRYSALHTCNSWAAEVLVHAGLPLRSGGVIFAGQLWRRVTRPGVRR